MNEEFDDRLRSRITDIFDNYEDDSAHEGWLLLREKYPEKKKDRGLIWLWWGSAAAVLLMVIGIGLWMNDKAPVKNMASNHFKISDSKTMIDSGANHQTTNTHQNKQQPTADVHIVNATVNGITKTQGQTDANGQTNFAPKKGTGIVAINKQPLLTKSKVGDKHRVSPNEKESTDNNNQQAATASPIASNSTLNKTIAVIDSAVLAGNTTKATDTKPTESIKPKETKASVFASLKPNEIKTSKAADKKVKFGFYAATYFNYSKGSDNQFNVGGGLSYDVKIAGNLRLLTGAVVGQNSFDFKSSLPQGAIKTLAVSIAANNNGANYTSAGLIVSPLASSVANNPVVSSYQANLIGFEIPMNLKYQFSKSQNYIAAGVSSGTYIENYKLTYNYANAAGYTSAVVPQTTQLHNQFGTFDFARTLNLAFGMGYPLGKNNYIIIEPFLKYPLSGLGSQDIKFGAGGINLKIDLKSPKK